MLGILLNDALLCSLRSSQKSLRFAGGLIVLFLGWFAYTGVYGWGIGQTAFAAGSEQTPYPPPVVQETMRWLRQNTPSDAVIAADWDYGSSINYLAKRATIVDEEQDLPTIRAFYQQVVCGEDPDVTLGFLRKHRVTHLMLTLQQIAALNQIWEVAYPTRNHQASLVVPLEPTSNTTPNYQEFLLRHPLFLPYAISSSPHPIQKVPETSKIIAEFVYTHEGYRDVSQPPKTILALAPPQQLSIRELIHNGQQWYFPEAELAGTLWVNDVQEAEDPVSYARYFSAFFFSELGRSRFITKLFLESADEHFKPVFSGGGGRVRIWEIQ